MFFFLFFLSKLTKLRFISGIRSECQTVWLQIRPEVLSGPDLGTNYSQTCVKRPLSKSPKVGFQDQLSGFLQPKGLQIAPRGAFCNTFDLH